MISLAKAHDLNEDCLEQSLYVNVREIKQEMEEMRAVNDSGPTDNADVATLVELVGQGFYLFNAKDVEQFVLKSTYEPN